MSEKTESLLNDKIKAQGYKIEKFYIQDTLKSGKIVPKRNFRILYNNKDVFIVNAFEK